MVLGVHFLHVFPVSHLPHRFMLPFAAAPHFFGWGHGPPKLRRLSTGRTRLRLCKSTLAPLRSPPPLTLQSPLALRSRPPLPRSPLPRPPPILPCPPLIPLCPPPLQPHPLPLPSRPPPLPPRRPPLAPTPLALPY